jgi:hypothetical protein
MIERVNEKVAMISSYNPANGQVMPRRMHWRDQEYTITKLGYHHVTRDGRHIYHIFSVTDGTTDFRLKFDTVTLHWTLEEISDGLAA